MGAAEGSFAGLAGIPHIYWPCLGNAADEPGRRRRDPQDFMPQDEDREVATVRSHRLRIFPLTQSSRFKAPVASRSWLSVLAYLSVFWLSVHESLASEVPMIHKLPNKSAPIYFHFACRNRLPRWKIKPPQAS